MRADCRDYARTITRSGLDSDITSWHATGIPISHSQEHYVSKFRQICLGVSSCLVLVVASRNLYKFVCLISRSGRSELEESVSMSREFLWVILGLVIMVFGLWWGRR